MFCGTCCGVSPPQTVQEYLEKNYKEDLGEEEALSLALSALTEVVEAAKKNLECAIVRRDRVDFLPEERIAREVSRHRSTG